MLRRLNKFSMIEHNLFSQPFKNTKVKKKKNTINKCQIFFIFHITSYVYSEIERNIFINTHKLVLNKGD